MEAHDRVAISPTKGERSESAHVHSKNVRTSPPCDISSFAYWPLRFSPLIILSARPVAFSWRFDESGAERHSVGHELFLLAKF